MPFTTGSQVRPFASISQRPVSLLESISAADAAQSVPFIRISRLDPTTGVPVAGVRPISVDLAAPPVFGASVESPDGRYPERPLVSLDQVAIETEQNYGYSFFTRFTLTFTVHSPSVVFSGDDRYSTWRSLLQEGVPHLLEYGWVGSSGNGLINGQGYHDVDGEGATGLVVPAIEHALFITTTYAFKTRVDGQMEFTVNALENSDSSLRNLKLGTFLDSYDQRLASVRQAAGQVPQVSVDDRARDRQVLDVMQGRLAAVPIARQQRGVGDLVRFGDVCDSLFDPLIRKALAASGYGRVDLFMGNFNSQAGSQIRDHGGQRVAGRSIADWLLPRRVLAERLGAALLSGARITLLNAMSALIELINDPSHWAIGEDVMGIASSREVLKPNIQVKTHPYRLKSPDGTIRTGFTLHVVDVMDGLARFGKADRLAPEDQTRSNVLARVAEKGLPIVQLGRALSYVKEAEFEVVLDEQIRAVRIEGAFSDRKERVSLDRPNVDALAGRSSPEQYVPMSVVRGTVPMLGNFVFGVFGQVWVDFGIRQLDGVFDVRGIQHQLGRGGFATTVSLISEGTDPLNTRRRLTPEDFARLEQAAASAQARADGTPLPPP